MVRNRHLAAREDAETGDAPVHGSLDDRREEESALAPNDDRSLARPRSSRLAESRVLATVRCLPAPRRASPAPAPAPEHTFPVNRPAGSSKSGGLARHSVLIPNCPAELARAANSLLRNNLVSAIAGPPVEPWCPNGVPSSPFAFAATQSPAAAVATRPLSTAISPPRCATSCAVAGAGLAPAGSTRVSTAAPGLLHPTRLPPFREPLSATGFPSERCRRSSRIGPRTQERRCLLFREPLAWVNHEERRLE